MSPLINTCADENLARRLLFALEKSKLSNFIICCRFRLLKNEVEIQKKNSLVISKRRIKQESCIQETISNEESDFKVKPVET